MSVFSEFVESSDNSIILIVPHGRSWKIQALHANVPVTPPIELYFSLDPDSTGPNSVVYIQDLSSSDTNVVAAAIAGIAGTVNGIAVFSLPDCWMPAGSEVALSRGGDQGPWNVTFIIQD